MHVFRKGSRRTAEQTQKQQQRIRRLRRRLQKAQAANRALAKSHEALAQRHDALIERYDAATERIASLKFRVDRMVSTSRDPQADLPVPEEVEQVISGVRQDGLTYLPEPDLRVLVRQVLAVETKGIPGLIIEAGTALGGSAIAMAAAKAAERPMLVYDVFGLIPPPSERDGNDVHRRYDDIAGGRAAGRDGEAYYGYRDDVLGEVTASFERHGLAPADNNISLVQGLFEETIEIDEPVAFAHLDGDWYDSTMVCLERIAPHVVPGGRIVLDDYFHWSGSRRAVDDFFEHRTDFRLEYRMKVHAVRR